MATPRTRGERRYQTRRHSRRAQRIEHNISHTYRPTDCTCGADLGHFRKSKAFQCNCRGKKQGAPKLAGSLHKSNGKYRNTVRRRIWNRRLARAWLDAVATGEIDNNELPGGPLIGRRRGSAAW